MALGPGLHWSPGMEPGGARIMDADRESMLAVGISRIHRSDSIDSLMQSFLSLVPTLVDADAFGLYLLDDRLHARAIYAVRANRGFLTEYEQLRMADPCFLHVLRNRSFIHTNEVLCPQDWMAHPLHGLMSRWGLRYSIAAPLMADGRLVGTLNIARRDRGYFESTSLGHARFLCDEMACVFERIVRTDRLEQDLARGSIVDESNDCRAARPAPNDRPGASGAASRRGTEPTYVRTVEDHIRAHHCAEPLTIESLAAIGGVSQRTLLEGFRRYRGTSPKAMLRELRFQSVRDALMAAQPGTDTVAAIATAWGFYEFGHFAVEYKRRYAETPSSTLRSEAARTAAELVPGPEIFELLDGAMRRVSAASQATGRCGATDSQAYWRA